MESTEDKQDQTEMDDIRLDRIRRRTSSGSRPSSPPPHPPETLPLGSSVKKVNIFKTIMGNLKSPAIETYSSSLNQSKPLAVGDLIWVRPARNQHNSLGLTGAAQNSVWLLITLVEQDGEESIDGSSWFFTMEGMTRVAKILLRKGEAWEQMPDMTSHEADQARRDRMSNMNHPHNILDNPRITLVKDGEDIPTVTRSEILNCSPSNRTNARAAAANRWRQEYPGRELIYGVQGMNGPIIIDSSDDPIEGHHHQHPHLLPLPVSPPRTDVEGEEPGQAVLEDPDSKVTKQGSKDHSLLGGYHEACAGLKLCQAQARAFFLTKFSPMESNQKLAYRTDLQISRRKCRLKQPS